MKSRLLTLAALMVLGVVSINYAKADHGCAAPSGPTCAAPSPSCGIESATRGCSPRSSLFSRAHGCRLGNCGVCNACNSGDICGNGDCGVCGHGHGCGCGHHLRGLFCHHGCNKCCHGNCGLEGLDPYFNCGCSGSYKFPVPPLSTYHWPGMYSAERMTDYHSPWRFPPIKPYTEEPTYQRVSARAGSDFVLTSVEVYQGNTQASGEVDSVSSRLSR